MLKTQIKRIKIIDNIIKKLSNNLSNKKIVELIKNNFSKRFKCNNHNIINFTDNFLSLFNLMKNPDVKYFITLKKNDKYVLYFILSGRVVNNFHQIKKLKKKQHIGVMMNLTFNKSNKINCADFNYLTINNKDFKHLQQIAKSISSQFTQSGGGYSVNPNKQIGFLPTYDLYTENCRPIFTGNLIGGSKCSNPNWVNCEQPYTFPKCI